MKFTYRIVLLGSLLILAIFANAQPSQGWDSEKIIGKRFFMHEKFKGTPFFNDDWINAEVTLSSGEKLLNVPVKYDGYHDELISYNQVYYSLIQIDKGTVEAFDFEFLGELNHFEKRYFNGLIKGDRYFQVYHHGTVDLLCFRQVVLSACTPYKENGITKNQEFNNNYRYFLYDSKNGYRPVSMKKKSLLRYIAKDKKKEAKLLIRNSGMNLKLPQEFAGVLKILEENNVSVY